MSDDTKRLDWIEEKGAEVSFMSDGSVDLITANSAEYRACRSLRSAIDAAMSDDPMNQPAYDGADYTPGEAIDRADDMRHERKERGE
jgi:hypothetical protein